MVTERGRTADLVLRARLADAYARCQIMRFVGPRAS